MDMVLRVFDFNQRKEYSKEIQDLIKKREQARMHKNWSKADNIREKLVDLGVFVNDKKVAP